MVQSYRRQRSTAFFMQQLRKRPPSRISCSVCVVETPHVKDGMFLIFSGAGKIKLLIKLLLLRTSLSILKVWVEGTHSLSPSFLFSSILAELQAKGHHQQSQSFHHLSCIKAKFFRLLQGCSEQSTKTTASGADRLVGCRNHADSVVAAFVLIIKKLILS